MKKVGICGGTEEFIRFIQKSADIKIVKFSTFESALKAAGSDVYQALIILPNDENELIPTLSSDAFRMAAQLKQNGQKLYIECYDAGDYASRELFGFIADAPKRGLYDEYVVWNQELLQMRKASYIPGRAQAANTFLTVDNCLGSHSPVIKGTTSFPLVVRSGSFTYVASTLSRFDRLTMLPHDSWKRLFTTVFAELLDTDTEAVQDAFESVWPRTGINGSSDIEEALLHAINWHLDSGIMLDRSGKGGIYEMIRSMDLSVRANERVDVIMLTAALFVTAGRHFDDTSLYERGLSLAEYGFNHGVQIEDGPNDGLFRWFIDPLIGSPTIFSSDNGRDAMALMQLHKVTNDQKFFRRLYRQGEMFLRWFNGGAYFKKTFFSLNDYCIESLPPDVEPSNSPVFYEGPIIALSYLFMVTGEKKWFDQVKRTADALYSEFPNYKCNYSPLTHNFLYSRLITVLLTAQEIGCGDYSDLINRLAVFFEELQSENGGIADHSLVDEEKSINHPEFAISMGKEYDKICDFLYCVNNILGACALAGHMRNAGSVDVARLKRMGKRLMSFTVAVQIRDIDNRLDGGWMRAFDLEANEYYGVNRDKDWGPYCIMGGWVMAFLPLIMLGELGEKQIYSID